MVKNNVINVSKEIFEANQKLSEDLRKIQNVSEVSMSDLRMFYIYSDISCTYVNTIMFIEFSRISNDNPNYSEIFGGL